MSRNTLMTPPPPIQRVRSDSGDAAQPSILPGVFQKLQRPSATADVSSPSTPGPSRKGSLRRHYSRGSDPLVFRMHDIKSNQSPLEPTGWRLSAEATLPIKLGAPLALHSSLDQQWDPPPSSPRAGGGTLLRQFKQYTRARLDEESTNPDQIRPRAGRRISEGSGHDGHTIAVADYITGRERPRGLSDANNNLMVSPSRPQAVYMPESPVTTGDKRIQQRKEMEVKPVEKRKVLLGHAFGKSNSRSRAPRAIHGKRKVLLLNETDEERRKREKESVEAWRAWAAACVASNYITPRRSVPRGPMVQDTPTQSPRVPKYDPPTRFSPLRGTSPRSSQPAMLVNGTETPLKNSSESRDAARTRSLDGRSLSLDAQSDFPKYSQTRRPSLRQAYTTGVEVSIRFRNDNIPPSNVEVSPRQSTEPKPIAPASTVRHSETEAGLPNSLLALRNRLASSIVRGILLELVHAVASYLEAVSASTRKDANTDGTWEGPATFCDEAVRRARRTGVLDTLPASDRDFWRDEVRELWMDLERVAGKPRYIRTIYQHGGYERKDDSLDAFSTMEDEYPRLLVDLEELMWGGLEPPEDELPFAFEVEEILKSTGQQHHNGSIGELASADGSRRGSTTSQALSSTQPAGRRRFQSVWTNDFLSALQEGGDTDAPVHPLADAPAKPLDFSKLDDDWTLACPGVKLVPGLTTLDLDLNQLQVDPLIPNHVRSSIDGLSPSRTPSRRGSKMDQLAVHAGVGASGKTKEELAEEGRARFEAWRASRQVQPLKQ